MDVFPTNRLTGLGLINERIKVLETPENYIYLDVSLFADPTEYSSFLFQDKIIILAELNNYILGIPSPTNNPRPDGTKIRLMSNYTVGPPPPADGYPFYTIYTLDDNNNNDQIIQYMYAQTYLTLVWNEVDQIWYPIRDIIDKSSTVTIARPPPSPPPSTNESSVIAVPLLKL